MTTQTAAPVGRIMLKNVRLAFAQGLTTPSTIPGADANAKPKYNCGIIVEAGHPQLKELETKMQAVAKDKWKDKAGAMYKALHAKDRLALHDGDLKPNYAGYPGNFYLSPSSDEATPPTWLGGVDGRTPLSAADAKKRFYSGCYVNVSVDIWPQDNQFGQRINAQLRGIQFLRDGDAFSAGRPADADEFEAVEAGADADDFA